MFEIDGMRPFYICNRARFCASSVTCNSIDGCKHTVDKTFAKNKEAVEVFEKFKEMFDICYVDENGILICAEKERNKEANTDERLEEHN